MIKLIVVFSVSSQTYAGLVQPLAATQVVSHMASHRCAFASFVAETETIPSGTESPCLTSMTMLLSLY